nr:hypothetical protein [uncultured Butyrivibrio sp.]
MINAFKPQTIEDIENRIEKLRKSYAPEWEFDKNDPDAGSVIAKIYAKQLEENNRLMSQMPERYHLEFVNMLDSTLRPAQPAGSMVVFNMDSSTVMGTQVPKGTRLSAESDVTDSGFIIYETDRNLYVTDAQIKNVFMTDAEDGTLTPIFGELEVPEVISGIARSVAADDESEQALEEAEDLSTEERYQVPPFTLFGEKESVGKSIFIIYEPRLFDGIDEPIYIRFEASKELFDRINNGEFVFKYFSKEGFLEFDFVSLFEDNKTFILKKKKECRKVTIEDKDYSVVILEATGVMKDSLEITSVSVSAGGDSKSPEYVGDGSIEFDVDRFAPFTDSLAIYNECYIGHTPCFSKVGARITLDFNVFYTDNILKLSAEEEEAELAIIKRKPRKTAFDIPASTKVNEIIIEYFNGIGWKKLKCDTEYAGMFENAEDGQYKLSFMCPEDWIETESGPYSGKCLRMRIVKADNCYMRPGIHTYPTIEKLRLSYSYEGKFTAPSRLEKISGTKKEDITLRLGSGKPFTVLSGIDYHDDALYIGLDKKLTDGPVSVYFQLSEVNSQSGVRFRLEYSSSSGFNETRITDLTEGFTRSGTIMFMPAADMARMTLEGNKLYWLRLVRSKTRNADYNDAFLPRIVKLCLNAVTVTNVQTSDENDYYIDDVIANNSISLGFDNILDASVWVNENGYTRKEEMESLMQSHPERVRVEYDFQGRITAFFVLWDEVDSFDNPPHKRCYRIDRMSGKIIFSDGNKCDMPRVTDDIAFKASIRSTDGENGNLGVGEITIFTGESPYIDTVYNPIRAHGGSSLESLDHAMARCAGIMHSRWRLVSESDYVRYVMEYSDSIDRCRVVVGETIEGGHNPEDISIVLLMKDCADGAFSFHRISAALQRDILSRCALTITENELHIVEPIFVSVSVCVWAMVMDMDDAFEVQNEVKAVLSSYLNPVGRENGEGWDIGTLPKETQILMRLGVLRSKAIIQRITMIGKYVDATGEHELDTKDIKITPFMVARNGEHKVIITNK